MVSASSSNWLDRLRSSRGFPTGEEPDLDRFLSSSSSGSAPTADSATHSESTQSQAAAIPALLRRDKLAECGPSAGEFAGVLCDLFNMGGEASRTSSKKNSRKQANPRFCGASSECELPSSSDDLRREKSENGGFVSSGDNSLNDKRENNNNNNINGGSVRVDEMKIDDVVEENVDLKSYSRSEVTIIDTSFEEWKSDKWLFRKNDEWKIKEKKSKFKSRVSGGKKRDLLVNNLRDNKKIDDDLLNNSKEKVLMKEADRFLQPNKGQPQNDKERRPAQERETSRSKVSQRRFPCPRPPEKSRKEDSPVILLKSIPSSNTNATIKAKRPKLMKIV